MLYHTMEMWAYMLFYFAIIMLKKHLSKMFFIYTVLWAEDFLKCTFNRACLLAYGLRIASMDS